MVNVAEGTPWTLICTDKFEQTVKQFRDVMSIPLIEQGIPDIDTQFKRYAQFKLPGGSIFEVVEPIESLQEIYQGNVYSITVADLPSARNAMETANIQFVSPIFDDKQGWGWTYFRGADGNIYQIQGPLID